MTSETVGTNLVVGLTVLLGASLALPVLGWCWTFDCASHVVPGAHQSPWEGSSWNGHPLAHYNGPAQSEVCWPILVGKDATGKTVDLEPGAEECQAVATAKDPNDRWHS